MKENNKTAKKEKQNSNHRLQIKISKFKVPSVKRSDKRWKRKQQNNEERKKKFQITAAKRLFKRYWTIGKDSWRKKRKFWPYSFILKRLLIL